MGWGDIAIELWDIAGQPDNGCFSIVMGLPPIAGGFMESPKIKWMIWGYPLSGTRLYNHYNHSEWVYEPTNDYS